MQLIFSLTAPNVLTVSNYLFSGADTNSAPIFSQGSTNISGTNFLTSAFDGLGIGILNKVGGNDPVMDISSITITGTNSVISSPPTITLQPTPVTVATNGACAFIVNASGVNVTYQWHRNGTNLIDGPNISGSTGNGGSSMLVVSPAGTSDVLSTNNGYYVTVSGAGGFSTNSVTNSLTLIPATNLYYASGAWDLHNSSSWDTSDSGSQKYVFDCGDPVVFGNNGGGTVTLNGSYLSAASATVSQSAGGFLTWTGSGSFAGPGNLIYNGSAQFTINNANSYSGGTIISNASANLRLGNLNGLGIGPVTMAGGKMEIVPAGGASSGIVGDIVVNNDSTIQYDALGSYAAVFLANLSGNQNATLTLLEYVYNAGSGTNNRVRIYGTGMTNDVVINPKIVLNDSDTVLAPYNTGGVQVYNGVISGAGTVEEKGYAIFNAANTYTGGNPGGMYLAAGNTGLGVNSDGSPGSVTDGPLGTGALLLWVDSTGASPANSGGIYAYGGARTLGNAIEYPSSTNNLTLVVNGTNDLAFTGPITLNGNDAFYTNTLPSNMVLYSNRTFQVTNTGLTIFSGVVSDFTNGVSAGMGLIKTGSGVLALSSGVTETYTGPTTVSNGTLQVNATLDPASAVTVSSNATLSGTGIIQGTVAVNAGGTLAPGAASIGTLNINNSLTITGNIKVRVNRAGSASDKAVVSGVLTNNGTGTVTVSNLGSTLQVGDTFSLFNKALSNGAAMTVIGGGVAWGNNLAVNGSIVVVSPPDVGVQGSVQSSVALGLNFTNTLTVTDGGPGSAYNIIVTDALPANLTFLSATGGGTTNANAGQVVWNISSLSANTTSNLTLAVKAATGGYATNIVSVFSSAVDPNLANNMATNVTLVTTVIIPGVSPHISSFNMVNGTNLVIGGTNGVTGGTYYLLDSTNIAKPLSQWVSVATNVVSTNGAANNPFTFTATNVVTPNSGQQFYILSNTNSNH
jgi:fibronectin-binding autotransporter adhesin